MAIRSLFVFALILSTPLLCMEEDPCPRKGLAKLGAGSLVRSSVIPRVPRLDELKAKVKAGPPTTRLKNMRKTDKTSASQIILRAEDGAVHFPRFLDAFDAAGIKLDTLTAGERDFVVSAVALHIATQLQSGSFRDLEGADDVLQKLDVTGFQFSDEYVAAVNYWNRQLPKWDFQIHSAVRHEKDLIDYGGQNFRRTIKHPNREVRWKMLKEAEREDFKISMTRHLKDPVELTNEDVDDFLRVREVLIAMRYRSLPASQEQTQPPTNLIEVLKALPER